MSSIDNQNQGASGKRVRFPCTGPRPFARKAKPVKAHPLKLPVPLWERLERARLKHDVEIPRNTWVALAIAEKLERDGLE